MVKNGKKLRQNDCGNDIYYHSRNVPVTANFAIIQQHFPRFNFMKNVKKPPLLQENIK